MKQPYITGDLGCLCLNTLPLNMMLVSHSFGVIDLASGILSVFTAGRRGDGVKPAIFMLYLNRKTKFSQNLH